MGRVNGTAPATAAAEPKNNVKKFVTGYLHFNKGNYVRYAFLCGLF